MELAILPLAITTMLGPQILVSIILITSKKNAVKVSLAYLSGILFAASTFILAVFIIARLFGLSADSSGHALKRADAIEVILVSLLIIAAVRTYLTRATAKPPKWLASLQDSTPRSAFKLALLLIYLMPTDIIVMLTVGLHLAAHGSKALDLLSVVPFLAVVLLIAGGPLLMYLMFRQKAITVMPKIRDWMQDNSWAVNIVIYVFFIILVVT